MADEITRFLDELAGQAWLGPVRRQWPRYLFHYTDLRNAASILTSGELLSRAEAIRRGLMAVDNASPEVITETDAEVHELVRFYFRPRTPTFWNNEGIRPSSERMRGSHCPVPIGLLFDARTLLSSPNVQIADGNRANRAERRAAVGTGGAFLAKMPFEHIYHDSTFTPEERDEIVFRRNAEVGIPHSVNLSSLRHVYARSAAELDTLRTLLRLAAPNGSKFPEDQMRVAARGLFFNRWSYVESVVSTRDDITIVFNPSSTVTGTFELRLSLEEINGSASTRSRILPANNAKERLRIAWPNAGTIRHAILRVELDGCLAYLGRVERQSESILDAN